jgi:hypothetical protein
MTMLTAVAAGVFGSNRAGDRRLADSKRAQPDQPNFPMTLGIWRFILASVGFVVVAVPLFWAIAGFGGPIGRPSAKREGAPSS